MTSLAVTDTGTAYPSGRRARDRFVLARRASRRPLDPLAHQGVVIEPERAADGTLRRYGHGVPDRTRVPLALRDVRPVDAHDRGGHAARRDPAADRRRRRGDAPGACDALG